MLQRKSTLQCYTWVHKVVTTSAHFFLPPPFPLRTAASSLASASGAFLQYFRAVLPLLSSANGSAPFASKRPTVSAFRPAAAIINGVFPALSFVLTAAALCWRNCALWSARRSSCQHEGQGREDAVDDGGCWPER